jgi:phosphopantetheinyl transferase
MIFIRILDTKGLGHCPSLESLLSEEERERLSKIKNDEARSQSMFSRLLLMKTYEEIYGEKMPEIHYTNEGKPYFDGYVCAFSLSHNENFVAVALNTDGEIGIDLQSFKWSCEARERIEKRFLSRVLFDGFESLNKNEKDAKKEKVSFSFFEISSCDGFEISENKSIKLISKEEMDQNESFLLRWTQLESLLKLSGGGFKDFKNINNCLQKTKVETRFFQHGGIPFAVSVAF